MRTNARTPSHTQIINFCYYTIINVITITYLNSNTANIYIICNTGCLKHNQNVKIDRINVNRKVMHHFAKFAIV